MNQNLMVHFSSTKGERTYTIMAPAQAPLGEMYDVCVELMNFLVTQAKANADQVAAQKAAADQAQAEVIAS